MKRPGAGGVPPEPGLFLGRIRVTAGDKGLTQLVVIIDVGAPVLPLVARDKALSDPWPTATLAPAHPRPLTQPQGNLALARFRLGLTYDTIPATHLGLEFCLVGAEFANSPEFTK